MQLFNVYSPKYDTGGRFWPIVHGGTIFSLVLMHVIAIGVFGLKKLPLASSLLVPLPVLTLLFNEYCRNRFLPIFEAYSTEVMCFSFCPRVQCNSLCATMYQNEQRIILVLLAYHFDSSIRYNVYSRSTFRVAVIDKERQRRREQTRNGRILQQSCKCVLWPGDETYPTTLEFRWTHYTSIVLDPDK